MGHGPTGGSFREESKDLFRHETRNVAGMACIFGLRLLGLYMVLPVLALHANDLRGATPFLVGLSVGSYGLTQAALQVPFGSLSDRYGRRRIIALGLLLFAAGSVLAARAGSVWVLILGRTLQGGGAVSSAVVALVADLTRPQVRVRAMAAVGSAVGVAFAAGMIMGPSVASHFGVAAVFWLMAAFSVVAAAYVLLLVPRPPRGVHHADVAWTAGQWGGVVHSAAMVRLDAGIFLLHAMVTALFVVGPGLMATHIPVAEHGKVYAAVVPFGVALMAFSAIQADRRGRLREAVVGGAVLLAAASVALAFAHHYAGVVAAVALAVGGVALAEPAMPAMLTRLSAAETRGTAAGLFHMSQFVGSFVGGALGGLLLRQPTRLALVMLAGAVLWLIVAWGLPHLGPAPRRP